MSGFIIDSDRFRRLSREVFWVVLGQMMAVLGTLVGVRVFTELLDPHAYGQLALGLTVAALVSSTVFGPLSNGATRFYAPAVEQGDLAGYLNVVRRQVLYATGVVIFMVLIAITVLMITSRIEWVVISITAFIFAISSGYNSILSGIQNAARQRSIVALHQGMEAWVRLLVVAGLIWWFGASSAVAIAGYAIAVTLVLVSQYAFFRKTVPQNSLVQSKEKRWQEQIWQYSWPFGVWGVFYWAQSVSDRWVLEVFSGTQEVGLYAVLFQLGYYPMLLLTNMVSQFLAPIFYQRAGDATESHRNASVHRLSWRVTGIVLGLTGAAFLIALQTHEQIFRIFVSSEYESVSQLLPWMLLASGIFSASQTLSLNLMSLMKTRLMMQVKIVTALLGVALNIFGAYWYGSKGVVIAGVLCSVVYFLWMVMLSMKKMS